MMRIVRNVLKYLKWIGGLAITLVLLCLVLLMLLYWSPVQNFVADKVAESLSDDTMTVSIGHVELDFPLKLALTDVKVAKKGKKVRKPDGWQDEETAFKICFDSLMLDVRPLPLLHREVVVTDGRLAKAKMDFFIAESKDTTKTEIGWNVFLENFEVRGSSLALQLPRIAPMTADMDDLAVEKMLLDFDKPEYSATHVATNRLDYTFDEIALTDICMQADSFVCKIVSRPDYAGNELKINVNALALKSKNPVVTVDSMRGKVVLTDDDLKLSDMILKTPQSVLEGDAEMDLNAFDEASPGTFSADVAGTIGKKDFMTFVGDALPDEIRKNYPDRDMKIIGKVYGNLQSLTVEDADITLPTVGHVRTAGNLRNVTDGDKFSADMKLMADADEDRLKSDIKMDMATKSYFINADIERLNVGKYLPGTGLGVFSGTVKLKGNGFDYRTNTADLSADVRQLQFGEMKFDNVALNASLNKGNFSGNLRSDNSMLKAVMDINGTLTDNGVKASVDADVADVNLVKMGFADERYVRSFSGNFDIAAGRNEDLKVNGYLSCILFDDESVGDVPIEADIDVVLGRDSTYFSLNSESLLVNLRSENGYEMLLNRLTAFSAEAQKEVQRKQFSREKLYSLLPDASLLFTMDSGSVLMPFINNLGYDFRDINVDLTTKRDYGIEMSANVNGYVVDSVRVYDAIVFVDEDSVGTRFKAEMLNENEDSTKIYRFLADGHLLSSSIEADVRLYDHKDEVGLSLGAVAQFAEDGMLFNFTGDDIIIDYKKYSVNNDNFIKIDPKNHVTADLRLVAEDNSGVHIYSTADNPDAEQDITLSVNDFRLTHITSMLPFLPNIKGTMDGDVHLMQVNGELSLSSDIDFNDFMYENTEIGNINTTLTLIPREDGESTLNGFLSKDGVQVAYVDGLYDNSTEKISAMLQLTRFPLNMVNAFIPDNIIGLQGYGEADSIMLSGTVSQPVINGEVYLDSAYLVSVPYGVSLRFDKRPVQVQNSRLIFDDFSMYGTNGGVIVANGEVDFSDADHIRMDVRVKADDFQIISSKRKAQSVAYGKAFVNFTGMLRGELSHLRLMGKADLLASTNMTYILKDSPLNTDNRLDGLVTFTNFNATDAVQRSETCRNPSQKTDLYINFTLNIVNGARIKCALNADESNYVDLDGGGTLRMIYSGNDLSITGRYNLNNGEMKYSLPIIPLKTFTIKDGSYIEFNGIPMNARLNITATCRTDATVGSGKNCRTVAFESGVKVTQTLQNLGLLFIIDAPEDMAIRNEMATMDADQKNKLALVMLSTGMYATEENMSNLTMNNALNAFLNGQISNIAGSALNSMDISVGMGNSVDAAGGTHTDYNFKFAKRLWNNRVSLNFGGTVSDNRDSYNGNSVIDNVSVDYRLDNTASRLLSLFYHKTKQDFLEGRLSEYGASLVLKKKMDRLSDLFRSSKNSKKQK